MRNAIALGSLLLLAACAPQRAAVQETTATLHEQPHQVQAAVRYLAALRGIEPERVSVASQSPTSWSPPLDCASAMGAEGGIPGYRVMLWAGAEEIEARLGQAGTVLILCPRARPLDREVTMTPPSGGAERDDVARRVAGELADQLEIDASELALVSSETRNFANAALGCPQPGRMYAQAIVPGVILRFRGPDGREIEVHAREDGAYWVQCEDGRPVRSSPKR